VAGRDRIANAIVRGSLKKQNRAAGGGGAEADEAGGAIKRVDRAAGEAAPIFWPDAA